MIISFEGIDKSGKSSISTLLHGYLFNHGKRAIHVREPGVRSKARNCGLF